MSISKKIVEKIKHEQGRLTKARQALLEVLANNHLTFKEIQKELAKRGYHNVSTLYNNLDYLISHKIVIELDVEGVKYYDIAIENPGHSADSHLHIVEKSLYSDEQIIREITYPEFYEFIKNHPELKDYDIDYIRILVSVTKK